MSPRVGLVVLAALAACAREPAPRPLPPTSATLPAAAAAAAVDVDVDVEVHAPTHVRWSPVTLGPPKPTLAVVLTNRGAATADVSDVRVRLEAVREGTPFRCAEDVGADKHAREPRTLAPGERRAYERTLDCALPLVGRYDVRVAVSFGRERAPRDVRAFSLRVEARKDVAPRAISAVPGLWAAVGASNVLIADERRGGAARIVVALVNGSDGPIELPPLALALRVTREGSSVACVDEPMPLRMPPALAAGAVYVEPLPVSCLGLDVPGVYDVSARAIAAETETEIGSLRVEITNDPKRVAPQVP